MAPYLMEYLLFESLGCDLKKNTTGIFSNEKKLTQLQMLNISYLVVEKVPEIQFLGIRNQPKIGL